MNDIDLFGGYNSEGEEDANIPETERNFTRQGL